MSVSGFQEARAVPLPEHAQPLHPSCQPSLRKPQATGAQTVAQDLQSVQPKARRVVQLFRS
ncbi:MAG: hypothetical protein C4K60_06065 [Ideonella sp. MAG2]|nr:MAG: hypothetical protein C4K60_06065 [Ideonella sp. MAG2]